MADKSWRIASDRQRVSAGYQQRVTYTFLCMTHLLRHNGRYESFGFHTYVLAALLCMLLTIWAPVRAAAEQAAMRTDGLPEKVTLNLEYSVEDAVFHLYRVADFSEDAQYTLSGEFENYKNVLPVIHAEDQSGWLAIAETLSGYVAADDRIRPVGNAKISGRKASFAPVVPGLYLLLCDAIQKEYEIYHAMPMLVSLPADRADGQWLDTLTVDAKPGLSDITGSVVSYSVVKHWENIPDGVEWPESVQVELRKNGEKMEGGIRTLSAENDWSAQWEGLDESATYTLTELDIPAGFTVRVTQMGRRFTVTNTALPPPDDNDTPPETEPPSPGGNTPGGNTPGGNTPGGNTPGGNTPGQIVRGLTPKTGDDTPVERWMILLTVSGLTMIFFGCRIEKRRERR